MKQRKVKLTTIIIDYCFLKLLALKQLLNLVLKIPFGKKYFYTIYSYMSKIRQDHYLAMLKRGKWSKNIQWLRVVEVTQLQMKNYISIS